MGKKPHSKTQPYSVNTDREKPIEAFLIWSILLKKSCYRDEVKYKGFEP